MVTKVQVYLAQQKMRLKMGNKQKKKDNKVAIIILVVCFAILTYKLSPHIKPLFSSIGFSFNSAVAESKPHSAGIESSERLQQQEVKAKELANKIVDGKMYIDTHIPKPPSYNDAPQFDKIMAVWNVVARVNEKGRENAYVWAGLKLDDASRREVINVKRLQQVELEIDAEMAETSARIAKYESEGVDSGSNGKTKFIGASGSASTDELGKFLAGGENGSQLDMVIASSKEDQIELRALVKDKAYIVVNNKTFPHARKGQTVANRYEVLKIDKQLECVHLADLKTEDRDEIAPICLN